MVKPKSSKKSQAGGEGKDTTEKAESIETVNGRSPRINANLKKIFGEAAIISGRDLMDKEREILSLTPNIDAGTGGGIMSGTLVTLEGPSGCGKTSLALHAAKKWQELDRHVFYIAAESRIYRMNIAGTGVDPDRMTIIGSHKNRFMTAEDYLLAVDNILKSESDSLIIVDSFSILSSAAEMSLSNYNDVPPPGGSNRLIGSWCRRMAPYIPINNNLVVGISQQYQNIGGQGKKWASSMPTKVKFARSTGLLCTHIEYLKQGDSPRAWGQKIHWVVERTPLQGGSPGAKIESIQRYGYGLDCEMEIVDQAKTLGLIDAAGSWITLTFMGDDPVKLQGAEKAANFLRENPEVYKVLWDRVRYLSFPEEDVHACA